MDPSSGKNVVSTLQDSFQLAMEKGALLLWQVFLWLSDLVVF